MGDARVPDSESPKDPWTFARIRDLATRRMVVKWAFLAFFVWLCVRLLQFDAWARGQGPYVPRPEAVAGILPVGHFTSFFAWIRGGGWDPLLPAGLVIIIAAITISLLFKRALCGWICPVGTVWESAALLGRKLFGRFAPVRVPRWLDLFGRGFRYVLTAAVLAVLLLVPLSEAIGFRSLPYMWVADIKIVEGLANPVMLGLIVFAFGLSVAFGPVWCRYLCPVGGFYSLFGMASVCTVKRDSESCIDCSQCNRSCHALVDVQHSATVRAPECDGCMDCVRVCPVDGCLEAKGPRGVTIKPWVWPLLVVGLWLAIYGGAKLTHTWDTGVTLDQFRSTITSGLLEQKTRGF
jgi:polyferredoxin